LIEISNARAFINNKISSNEIDKVAEAFFYLETTPKFKNEDKFTIWEKALIAIYIGNWDLLESVTKNHSEIDKRTYNSNINTGLIAPLLYRIIKRDALKYQNSFETHKTDIETKKILRFFLYSFGQIDRTEYNLLFSEIKEQYPHSDYLKFLNKFLVGKYIRKAIYFSLGSGIYEAYNNLNKNTDFKYNVNFNLGLLYDNFFNELSINTYSLELDIEFEENGADGLMQFNKGETISCGDIGLKSGYYLMNSKFARVAPFSSLSYYYIESDKYNIETDENGDVDTTEEDKEIDFLESFSLGFGLRSEIHLYQFSNDDLFDNSNTDLYIKFDFGYNFVFSEDDERFKGNFRYLNIALGFNFGAF
jgi:hypothetical protein